MIEEKESKQKGQKEEEKHSKKEILEKIPDEIRKLSRGFIFAGLESLSITADMTRNFVDETIKRNSSEKRDTSCKLTDLHNDMTDALFDTLDKSINKTEKIVDKFSEKYKEQ